MAHLEWENDAKHIIAVRFDAVRTVDHRLNAAATSHPVEDGADIADHVRVGRPAVSVTGYVSKAPLTVYAKIGGRKDRDEMSGSYESIELPSSPFSSASILQGGIVQAGIDAISSITSPNKVTSLVTNDVESRVRAMTELLTEAMEACRLVRFVDEAKDYDDMVITSMSATRTQQDKGGTFSIELEQIKFVETKLVDLPVPMEPRGMLQKAAGAAAAKLGQNENTDEKQKSMALRAAQGLLSGVGLPNVLAP